MLAIEVLLDAAGIQIDNRNGITVLQIRPATIRREVHIEDSRRQLNMPHSRSRLHVLEIQYWFAAERGDIGTIGRELCPEGPTNLVITSPILFPIADSPNNNLLQASAEQVFSVL